MIIFALKNVQLKNSPIFQTTDVIFAKLSAKVVSPSPTALIAYKAFTCFQTLLNVITPVRLETIKTT
jgi:hypothetical protein